MKAVSQGKIFLADQRGWKETPQLKRFSTFNFERFFNPVKAQFDQLYLFNEDQLAGRQKTCFEIDRDSYIIILPITGAVNYLDDTENETDVDVEEAAVVYVEKGTNITLSNPFDHDVVNYLCIGLAAYEPMPNNPQFFSFDLSKGNQLLKITNDSLPFHVHVGRFDGRKEAIIELANNNKIFTFVISGAFEVDGRLMHEKDGLGLWDSHQIELEALSNHAVVVVIELDY